MFEKILVPVDLTEKNESAVQMARDMALTSGGSVTLLHVIEPLDLPFEELEDFYEELEERAVETMDRLAEALRTAGLEPSGHVSYGERARQIVEFAGKNGFDLILLTSRRADPDQPGESWATISHKVAILAQTPVLLVK